MIYIKSRTRNGKLVTHRWPTTRDMLAALETGSIGSEFVQLVVEDDKVIYSSLNDADPFLGPWLRISDAVGWFVEELNVMPWRTAPEDIPVQHEILPGDFSLEGDAEWKDMPEGEESFWLYGLKANQPLGVLLGAQFENLDPAEAVFISAVVRVGYDMIDSYLRVDFLHPYSGVKEYRRLLSDREKVILLAMIQKREAERLHNLYQTTSAMLEGGPL